MNATVTAAAIGVGGSVIVALAALGASVWNTDKTTQASRDAVKKTTAASRDAVEVSRLAVAAAQRTVELTEQGQVTDRYTKAIEQLGSDKSLPVRIGGIYALERIARDSPRDLPTVMEVLTAFIREHSGEQWQPAEPAANQPQRATPLTCRQLSRSSGAGIPKTTGSQRIL